MKYKWIGGTGLINSSFELALLLAFLVNIKIYEDGLIELSYEWNSVKLNVSAH